MRCVFDKICERDMDFLILEEFVSESEFAEIFLSKAKLANATVLQSYHSLVDIQHGESDIEILVECNGEKYDIMIEDKIDAKAMPEQCARYHARGKKRIDEGVADHYVVFIAAPQDYLQSNPEAQLYPHQVSYEELKAYFDGKAGARSAYKSQIIQKALDTRKAGYVPIEHVAITEFWQKYYAFKKKYYADLNLPEVKGPRGGNAIWAWFNTSDKRMKVSHKSSQGYVDLTLAGMGDHVKEAALFLAELLDEDMAVVKTSKSAAVRIKVPYIDFCLPFETYDVEMHQALKAVTRLVYLASKIDYDELSAFVVPDNIPSGNA